MAKNSNLHKAKDAKNDEFYTQLTDIEKELKHYRDHFKGATVLCNCDDPEWSNFWKYFHLNFEFLGLKKLITTHYDPTEPTYKMEYEGGNDNDITVGTITPLKQNGDFRSPECIELLKEATIVVTNPPFSLFREYVAVLMEHDKKFLIIGSMNAITYKEVFHLLKDNKVWLGCNPVKEFLQPDGSIKKFGNILWYTNLDIAKRHEELNLIEKYSPDKYPHYDNYNAIEISKVLNIPVDYDGAMGVPITFLDKYNPEQFDIVALGIVGSCEFTNNREMIILDKTGAETKKKTWNAKGTLYRKHLPTDKKPAAFKDVETGELYQSIYARILIKRKDVTGNEN